MHTRPEASLSRLSPFRMCIIRFGTGTREVLATRIPFSFPSWQHRPIARPRPDFVYLRRIDPNSGMWQFYSLTLQPTLLGGVDLVRRWGRTGTVGSSLIQAFADEAMAQPALGTLAERKRRRSFA